MALQFIDGFDHYFLTNDVGFTGGAPCMAQKWDSGLLNGSIHPDITKGRFALGALTMEATGGQGHIQKNTTTDRDEMVVGFAFLPHATRTDVTRIHFRLDDGTNVKMELNMATRIASAIVNDVTTVASSSAVLNAGVWNYLEFKVKIHSSLGTVEIRQSGVNIASATGLNTGTTGVLINGLRLEANDNAQADFIDDLYWLDITGSDNTDFLGDVRVDVLYPNANGNNNDFTLFDDGTQNYSPITVNFDAVRNEADFTLGRDHNYVESGLIGASEDYDNHSLADIGVTPSTIFGVQVVNNTKKTDTGVLRYKDEMVIAGTPFDNGSEVTATAGDYSMSRFIRDTDPSDDAAWTESKVAAVGSGFTITFREV
ncbi:MAG: hypothetical protein V3T88_07240 [Nitrosomonadaceae bacterium]